MTLFELLVVMIIIGVVYSLALFTLKKEKATAATVTLSGLYPALASQNRSGGLRMVCDLSCRDCRVYTREDALHSTLRLKIEGEIERYGFDRFGQLRRWGPSLGSIKGTMEQSCFEYTLHPDGTASPLILKHNTLFYAFTPLQGDKPFITGNEEALRAHIYNVNRYPLRGDDYYGAP